jgi:hypothetical protein
VSLPRTFRTWKLLSNLTTSNSLGNNSSISSKGLLTHNPQSTNQQHQSLKTKHNSQSDHSANNAIDNRAKSISTLLVLSAVAVSRRRSRGVRSTSSSGVATSSAPSLCATDAEFIHAGDKVVPRDDFLAGAEERVSSGCAVSTSSTVVEQEANGDVAGGRERRRSRCVGDEFESHGGGVIDHTVEVRVDHGQVGETEEGREGGVGAELHVELALALGGDGVVQGLDNLGGEDLASDGTHVVGRVVSETPFVGVGKR